MSRFLEALHSGRVLLMDGAMGTELQRAGLRDGECCEQWNLTNPDAVREIHRRYLLAGALCLLTNTFQANPEALAKHGLRDRLTEINETAVALAHSVCGDQHFVVGDVGPLGHPDQEATQSALDEIASSLHLADALLLETWSSAEGLSAAEKVCQLAWNSHRLPVLLSISYSAPPAPTSLLLRTLETAASFTAALVKERGIGIAALGVNCGRDIGMDEILAIIRGYRCNTSLPLFVRPNAGTPIRMGDRWVYPHTPTRMAARLPELLEAGVAMVGGCCGTTPEHIAAFRPVVDAWNAR
jgi:5-methyltetrahydrofolate--homocysteine methyltransferase